MKEICRCIHKWLPKELIVESNEETESAVQETGEIPDIEGLDVREGIANCGSLKLFLQLLGDFYKLIDAKALKIEKCLADGMLRDYTVEVHALKNTARMIGAQELSDMFYQCEQMGNAEEESLDVQTAATLEKFRSYKQILKPYGQASDQEREEVPAEYLIKILERIRKSMDEFDLDGVDAAMKRLEECRIPRECQKDAEELVVYVADVAMEEVMELAGRMIETLRNR